MKRSLTCIAVGVTVGFALVAPAAADAPKVKSTVHMHGLGPDPEYDSWVGDVHSRKRKCERGRTVTVVYHEAPKPFEVGSDVTDRLGHWRVQMNFPGDDPYHAEVKRRVVGSGDNKVVCKADRSPNFSDAAA